MSMCRIYLADLGYVRQGQEWTIVPVPLNVAYIAAFLNKMRPGAFEITIFKNPMTLLEAIERQAPDIAAFSNYIWNKNLQLACARHLKQVAPGCITVMGGPNYHFKDPVWLDRFVKDHPQIDFHIEGEGEVKFYNLAACILEHGRDLDAVKQANPAGVTFVDPGNGRLVSNDLSTPGAWASLDGLQLDLKAGRLMDLNDIPSPYLTGVLDAFLADPIYCPIVETNRGCPYECTFCNWGDMGKSRSSKFATDRVEDELRYIAEHNVSATPFLYIGDANFGLFERDVAFARLLRDLKETHGFPRNVYLYYAKNSTEKVVRIAEILKGMTRINLSRQTQNADVLANIKRSNISIDTFSRLTHLAKELGVESFVELIYGLPGESKDSFFAGVKAIMRQHVDGLHLFPAMLLDGSEMGTAASRAEYGITGEFRRIDGCGGRYGPVAAMEFEEIITGTSVMTRDDYFEIRLFHFFQTLFLDTKLYRDTETLIGGALLFDLIEDVIGHRASAPPPVQHLIDEFMAAAKAEFVADPSQVDVGDADTGHASLVKLNPLFICKVLYDPGVRQAFHLFLKTRILAMGHAYEKDIDRVLRHIDESIYPFDKTTTKEVSMAFDPVAFAGRPFSTETRPSDYVLDTTTTFRYTKPFTYGGFIDAMPSDLPLSAKVYDVILHHTHETFRKTLTWTIAEPGQPSVEAGRRQIENEGGWLY